MVDVINSRRQEWLQGCQEQRPRTYMSFFNSVQGGRSKMPGNSSHIFFRPAVIVSAAYWAQAEQNSDSQHIASKIPFSGPSQCMARLGLFCHQSLLVYEASAQVTRAADRSLGSILFFDAVEEVSLSNEQTQMEFARNSGLYQFLECNSKIARAWEKGYDGKCYAIVVLNDGPSSWQGVVFVEGRREFSSETRHCGIKELFKVVLAP
ncbi:hypothetical protein K438DRAFT_2071907 [Mycena galopus ATCC 62051]|nr:hypothetical protein K438DRAFT_2071907 [Mycena galopus ATCC 62051]